MTVTGQQRQKLSSRKAILDAANVCYARTGIVNTTIDDIAEQAGLGRATVYRHFKNHEDILTHLIQREFDDIRIQMLKTIDAKDDATQIIRDIFDFVILEFPKMPLYPILVSGDATVIIARLVNRSEVFQDFQLEVVNRLHRKIKASGQLRPGTSVHMLADWLNRITLSLYALPCEYLDSRKNIHRYVDTFIIPSVLKSS